MKVCVLGSGSKGNSIYIESGGAGIIIDQGFSHTKLKSRLEMRGIDEKKIKAIIVSHEHEDHVAGVGITARKLDIPVYCTAGTFKQKKNLFNGDEKIITIESGKLFCVGKIEILPFNISHDATEPVQFSATSGGKKVSVATDLGFVSTLVEYSLRNSDIIVIEANHDPEMLKKGPYPWELKQRIMGRTGHLSNKNAADILFNISANGSTRAVLAHLSEENNTKELALKEVVDLFESYDRKLNNLTVACQELPTELFEI